MALLLADGFDSMRGGLAGLRRWGRSGNIYYGPDDISGRHPLFGNSPAGFGRNGGLARQGSTVQSLMVGYPFRPSERHAIVVMGVAMRNHVTWSTGSAVMVLHGHNTVGQDVTHLVLTIHGTSFNPPYLLKLWRYNGTDGPQFNKDWSDGTATLLATTTLDTTLWPNSTDWHYLELKATISDAGSWEVRVDETTVMSGSGDTKNNNAADSLVCVADLWDGGTHYDDAYILNGDGTTPNDFLGDVTICGLMAGSDASIQWTRSAGTNSADLVDDFPFNLDETTYVEGRTNGDKDLYNMLDLPVALTPSDQVKAVVTYADLQRPDTGSRHVKLAQKAGGTEVDSSDILPVLNVNEGWRIEKFVTTTKPAGGAWDETAVNGLQVGAVVSA